MSSTVVYESSRNGGNAVFDYDQMLSGTTYNITLNASQSSVASMTTPTFRKVLTASQFSQVIFGRSRPLILSVTQASTVVGYTDTTLLGSVTTVSQNSTGALLWNDGDIRAVNSSSVASLAMTIFPGAGHSTFFINPSVTQSSVAGIVKGIQTIRVLSNPSTAVLDHPASVIQTYDYQMPTTQRSVASLEVLGPNVGIEPGVITGRKPRGKRFIEINGKAYPIDNEQDAVAILARVEAEAAKKAAEAVAAGKKPQMPTIKTPEGETIDALMALIDKHIAATQKAMAEQYQRTLEEKVREQAAQAATVAQQLQEDDEAIALLLSH